MIVIVIVIVENDGRFSHLYRDETNHGTTTTTKPMAVPLVVAVGPNAADSKSMLATIGFDSFDEMIGSTVPANILTDKTLDLEPAMSEMEALGKMKEYADKNQVMKSYIGACLLYTSPSPRDQRGSRMPSSA